MQKNLVKLWLGQQIVAPRHDNGLVQRCDGPAFLVPSWLNSSMVCFRLSARSTMGDG